MGVSKIKSFCTLMLYVAGVQCLPTFRKEFVEPPTFKEKYFNQFVDHFNLKRFGKTTYAQRYLITGEIGDIVCIGAVYYIF